MKKKLTVIVAAVVLVAAVFALAACTSDDAVTISGYEIADSSVYVGDAHGKPSITATLSDGTTKTVSNNLVYDQTDIENLLLDDDDCYTQSGEYTVKVYILEQQDKYYIGEWSITVKAKK